MWGLKFRVWGSACLEMAGLRSGGKQGKHGQAWFTFHMENVMVLL